MIIKSYIIFHIKLLLLNEDESIRTVSCEIILFHMQRNITISNDERKNKDFYYN